MALERVSQTLRLHPFGQRALDCEWDIKRQLYRLLPDVVVAAAGNCAAARKAACCLINQLLASGYAQSSMDRRRLVELGAWRPSIALLNDRRSNASDQAAAVKLYVHLAEHVNFYDDLSVYHADFWHQDVFNAVLRFMPLIYKDIPDSIEADLWELLCPELEAALKTTGWFLICQSHEKTNIAFDVDQLLMPFLSGVVETISRFDGLFGREIGAKTRGDVLEELVRLCSVLTQQVLSKFEDTDSSRSARRRIEETRKQGATVCNFLVKVLMLEIPTCTQKADAAAPGSGALPVDERQLDSEWIEGLTEHCEDAVKPAVIMDFFRMLTRMPLEEQKYRLECASPLVPPFVGNFQEQLRANVVPPELADLKAVLNAVLAGDDSSVGSDLLEEISFYPCLLDFATKRATIHAVCERHKMQGSTGDPIRLVVPRDNVLDGVCTSLNLQDRSARIEVPLEIEFRSGYADDTGNELVDEGEDQGGLRRQWLDRAARYFISSDLFLSPAEDAAHLESSNGLPTNRGSRGVIYVPSPESVCRCVQDDWEEQFELFGCILGFTVLYKETIPVHFGHNFLRSVFGLKTDAQDLLPLLESVDKTLHTKLKYILDGSYSGLGDTLEDALDQSNLPRVFALNESHCPELVKSTVLKDNGDKLIVTEANKEEFVMLLLDRLLISGVARQVEFFRKGLLRVVPDHIVQRIAELMSVKEIELMVCGSEEIDVDDWEKHTQYENGFTHESQPVRWFWDVVRAMAVDQRAALLSFATGSSQVPSGGFRFLQPELFTIQRVAVSDRYPEAHTCANTIDLPVYGSGEELARRLEFAIKEAGDAFGRR